jgi:hypothetical protein
MADAKPTGGGGFETFEIIVGIILLLAVINTLMGGNRSGTVSNPSTKTDTTTNSTKNCGLSVTSPKSGSTIGTTFNLTGKTDGCNWASTSETALFVQVIDGKGKPVSEFIKIPPLNFEENKPVIFNSTIGINATPAKGTGYVILIPAQDNPNNPITYRIPVKFK